MSSFSNQISALNTIITTLYDGENGFKQAADTVDNAALATKFRSLSQQRYDFGHAIKPFIKQLGGEVNEGGSPTAAVHRGWIDFKTNFTGNDEVAVLNECIRGEESALNTYQDVIIDEKIPAAARAVLREQLDAITSSLNDMRKLANSYETA
ncbi:ferritin-like domain-containing protein [Neolewinella agarilytica]|uniref:DUF2383 domain-containing protein n=1 Tax=Neolewinella agarilytica TaxID=478744 RepID=A0A1H9C4M2_9BACT|nr:PA2169 family four-helix-bundle protein [Neolewinella agarilytica]SEP96054.1 conserved hypothetical protein [Neolewinella agarilytica]